MFITFAGVRANKGREPLQEMAQASTGCATCGASPFPGWVWLAVAASVVFFFIKK